MEPFSLFHFLQNLLSSTAFPQQNTDQNSENSTPPLETEQAVKPSTVNPSQNSSQDAVLKFLSAHDARVSRSKQKR